MAYKKRFDTSTAYGQLILLVFLPICVLAMVGGLLVFHETMRASDSEQQALAEAVLIRYKPMATELIPTLLEQERQQRQDNQGTVEDIVDKRSSQPTQGSSLKDTQILLSNQPTEYYSNSLGYMVSSAPNLGNIVAPVPQNMASADSSDGRADTDNPPTGAIGKLVMIRDKLSRMQSEQHVQRIAIIRENNQVLATVGYGINETWPMIDTSTHFLSQRSTPIGTAYGSFLGEFEGQRLWLLIDMDNEPLYIARYRIAMALMVTGLFTILILLLSLNIYAKRWIAPIYELRLQLQRTNVDNLYKPIPVESDGELNLLQQDLVKTLRRLHSSFQELKSHAEQTEDDLRLAFDEMEMQNISIRNARDAAISTSQAKSAFLTNISHELRTPLNSIDGFINLLARHGELNPEQDLYVQTIRKSSAHLLALVNDVLDFSKIEAGKLVLDQHEFDLYDTIYDVVDMLSPVAAEKGLRMAVMFYNDVPMQIVGDALRLKQILTNIVGNAIKFTDTGEVVVRVSLDDHQDNCLMISVQDSGKGISPADQNSLFRSFSQGDPSITRQYGGTGLGLVISKQLVRLMGGDIGFYDNAQENIAKQGATFWFRMPAHVEVLDVATGASIPPPVLAPLAHSSDTFNMLVWINHNASRQVLGASLQSLPIRITQANSLPGMLQSLKEQGNDWDWVIVDTDTQDDMMALLKQIRLHYQGKLGVFGYQVSANQSLLGRYHAKMLYEPLDKRQLYAMLDTARSKSVAPSTPRWEGVTVLAVDDHLPNLLVLDALLSELGIQVITANSGFEAIEIVSKAYIEHQQGTPQANGKQKTALPKAELRQQDRAAGSIDAIRVPSDGIDLIFMDIQMPRMSGREAAAQIRNIESGEQRIPIIALTAHGLSDERDKLMTSGIDDYVGKPISQPQLLQVLQKWLGRTNSFEHGASSESAINAAAPMAQHVTETKLARPSSLKKIRDDYVQGSKTPQNTADQANTEQTAADTSAAPQQQSLAILDWEDALMRSANKPDLASKLLTMMIESVDDEKEALARAWQTHDRAQLGQIAHRILGASRYTGVPELRFASQNLEDKCLLNTQHTTAVQFAMLAPYYDALQQALDNLKAVDLVAIQRLSSHRLSEHEMTWKMI
ncbi:ATP-binding protein [Psychrobacter aestuarii]|uniref:histidine kinase n=1 Tax=Psychrobacter aestuarii TaxID=556327 RepID=A0ABN0VKU6_9GAMM|nr:ATP-binding protein [Psychrobacter aestuarii]